MTRPTDDTAPDRGTEAGGDPEHGFELDERLRADTHHVASLDLCELLLMDDARWPWLILVPRRAGARELHHLDATGRAHASEEHTTVAAILQDLTGAASMNVAALGNVVAQLHLHVVARSPGDPNWPGPVWGHGERRPYDEGERDAMIERVRAALHAVAAGIEAEEGPA